MLPLCYHLAAVDVDSLTIGSAELYGLKSRQASAQRAQGPANDVRSVMTIKELPTCVLPAIYSLALLVKDIHLHLSQAAAAHYDSHARQCKYQLYSSLSRVSRVSSTSSTMQRTSPHFHLFLLARNLS